LIIGSELFDPQYEFIGKELRDRLGDIGPGKTNSIETPAIRLPGKPLYGSFTFFVRYDVNVFGGHWTRDFYLGTCQWNFEGSNVGMSGSCKRSDWIASIAEKGIRTLQLNRGLAREN